MLKKITIKEIAKMANVSIGTVDRVLHNRGRVAETTRDKILKIAEEGNYSSNIYARNLKLNKVYKIAVVLPMLNSYWNQVSTGVKAGIEELASMGFSYQQFVLDGLDNKAVLLELEEALNQKPDGLIFGPSLMGLDSPLVKRLDESMLPYVFVDANIEGANNLSFVGQDAFQSGVMAGRLLNKDYSDDFEVYAITFNKNDLLNTTIVKRIAGLEHFYKNRPEIQINNINLERDNIDISELKNVMSSSNKPVHILVPNSTSHIVANELCDIRETLQLRLVGYDLIEKNKKCLSDQKLDYIIDQKPVEQGILAVQALYKHVILKNQVPNVQHISIDVFAKENLV